MPTTDPEAARKKAIREGDIPQFWEEDHAAARMVARDRGITPNGKNHDELVDAIQDTLDEGEIITADEYQIDGESPTSVARRFIAEELSGQGDNPLTGDKAGITRREVFNHLTNRGIEDEDRLDNIVSGLIWRLRQRDAIQQKARGVYAQGEAFDQFAGEELGGDA